MPFPNYIGRKRYWTRGRVLEALRAAAGEIRGPLPCHDRDYNIIKKGRLDWPTSHRVLEYYGSLARAWLAAGAPMKRIRIHNINWLPEETAYLLDFSGVKTLAGIAKHLGRTYGAVRKRLYSLNIRARDNEGYMSAAQISTELPCSCSRLRRFLAAGLIPGATLDRERNRWKIDPGLLTPELIQRLTTERRTHKTWPLDVGDYYARYGIRRLQGAAS